MMSIAAAIATLLIAAAILLLREFTSGRAFRVIGYGARFRRLAPAEPSAAAAPSIGRSTRIVPSLRACGEASEPELPFEPATPDADRDDADGRPSTKRRWSRLERRAEHRLPATAADAAVAPDDPRRTTGAAERRTCRRRARSRATGRALPSSPRSSPIPPCALALFAGAEGGEGAGDIAFAAARQAAREQAAAAS